MSNIEPESKTQKAAQTKRRLKPTIQQLKLHEASASDRFRVLSVHLDRAGSDELELLGISPGVALRVVENDHKGTVAVNTRNGSVILGRRFTYKTTVSPIG